MIPEWNPITQIYEWPDTIYCLDCITPLSVFRVVVALYAFIVFGIMAYFALRAHLVYIGAIPCIIIQIFSGAGCLFSLWRLRQESIMWNAVSFIPQYNYGEVFLSFLLISVFIHGLWIPAFFYFQGKKEEEREAAT